MPVPSVVTGEIIYTIVQLGLAILTTQRFYRQIMGSCILKSELDHEYNLITDVTQYNEVLLSFAAPSTAGFVEISPKGRGHGCRASLAGQEVAATEPPFLWILSFDCAKESISPSGANTRLTHRRDSDLIICVF